MKVKFLLFCASFLLISCATILNSDLDSIKVVSNEAVKIKVENDTLDGVSDAHIVSAYRSKNWLEITAFNDQKQKTVKIKSRSSIPFWLNLAHPASVVGFLVDWKNPRRYSYPKTVYIDLNKQDDTYLPYKPQLVKYKYSNGLKLSPLKPLAFMNSGFEVAYERRWSSCFTTQLSVSKLFEKTVWNNEPGFNPNTKGFQLAFEKRFYYRKSAPLGLYIAFEFSYFQSTSHDIGLFGEPNVYADSACINTCYTDIFGVDKKTYSFNLKIGYQFIKERFSVDMSIGLGARFKNVSHFDRLKPEDELKRPHHINAYYIANRDGMYWTPSFPVNIKLGWFF